MKVQDRRSVTPPRLRCAVWILLCVALVGAPRASCHAADTLWIFDSDFEDLVGDNAGWTTLDHSHSIEHINYWHKDTIRINGFTHLGDSTWWCGTYDDCWRQPRGYGNDWTCILERSFPEVAALTGLGDPLFLEYDQRFAIESCYDYGYVDVSTPGDTAWTTIVTVSNEASCPGFEWPGRPKNWDSTWWFGPGHMLVDLSAYSGTELALRYRFESDANYSCQDQHDNTLHSMLDGAWQLDNIKLWAETPESVLVFFDDCESPGDNGWIHESIPASGQTGIVFDRVYENTGGHSGWVMAAYDTASGAMVDGQSALLFSPPIDISGVSELVARWEGWVEVPLGSDDYVSVLASTAGDRDCLWGTGSYGYGIWDWWTTPGDTGWVVHEDDWSDKLGDDWLGIRLWALDNDLAPNLHGKGFLLDRIRVGVPMETGAPDGDIVGAWISRAHPNPFGTRTTITYGLQERGHVTLTILDLSGRVVTTLVNSALDPGDYKAHWGGTTASGERAASGVYFVKMEANGVFGRGNAARKLVLLK